MSTAVAVAIPTNIALPAYLQTPDIAAQIAAENAAAAGGIRVGGFPKVSIEGGKFHEVNGGETNTFMMAPAAQGQPALPMMCFEAVIIAANPALVKKYYKDKWQKGSDAAPDCQSNNGVTPDASVASPQHSNCAQCPQNAWGSKISEATGKEVKACSDSKQMVVLPAWFQGWTEYKALGLSVTPAALGDWGKYVQALSGRSIPVSGVVTNITFDQTASYPKLMFSFNRFLTPDEFARVQERAKGDDVKNIVQPTVFVPPVTALPAPTVAPALAAPAPAPAPAPAFVPPVPALPAIGFVQVPAMLPPQPAPAFVPAANPAMPPYSPPTVAAAPAGFGAAPAPTPVTAPVAPEEPPKRTRAKRTPAPAIPTGAPPDMSHIPANIQATIAQVGGPDSPAGKALMAAFPAPQPVAGQDANPSAPTGIPAPAAAPAQAPTAPPAGVSVFSPNFAAPPVAAAPTAQTVASGASLRDILQKKLGVGAGLGA